MNTCGLHPSLSDRILAPVPLNAQRPRWHLLSNQRGYEYHVSMKDRDREAQKLACSNCGGTHDYTVSFSLPIYPQHESGSSSQHSVKLRKVITLKILALLSILARKLWLTPFGALPKAAFPFDALWPSLRGILPNVQQRQDPTLLLRFPHDSRLCQLSPNLLRGIPHFRHMSNRHLQVLLKYKQMQAHAVRFLLDVAAELVSHVAHLVFEVHHLLLYCLREGSEHLFVGAVLIHAGEQSVIFFHYARRDVRRAGCDGVIGVDGVIGGDGGETGDGDELEKLGIKHAAVLSRFLIFKGGPTA